MGHRLFQKRLSSRPLVTHALMIGCVLASFSVQATAEVRSLEEPAVAELNKQLNEPDILFANRPKASLNGKPVLLLGMTDTHIWVLTPDGRQRSLKNSTVRAIAVADGSFVYEPRNQSLKEFAMAVSRLNNLRARYGVIVNDEEMNQILFGGSQKMGTNGIAGGPGLEPKTGVPLPQYASARPWENVALLNPPKPPPRPAPVLPPTTPPAAAPVEAPGGIPQWAKFAIAGTAIMGMIVFFKR